MNCQEFKSYFEDISLMSADPSAEPGLTEHIAGCSKCAHSMEAQNELRTSLSFLRESASSPSSALDEVVLANYREQVAGFRASAEAATARKPGSRPSLRWAFGFAAAMALVTIVFWPREHPGVAIRPAIPISAISSVRPEAAAPGGGIPGKASARKSRNGAPKRTQAGISSATMSNPVPEGFRSLMYCDELSCGGAMDVVRIELQPSEVGLIAAAPQSRNVVSADVLVGPDGIARGIRIVR